MSTNPVLQKYEQWEPEDDHHPVDTDETQYRAFVMGTQGREETALKIIIGPKGMKPQYAHLVTVLWESDRAISLVYTDSVIVLMGRNLLELADRIGDKKVRQVRCFLPGEFPEPDAHEAVVESIMLQSRDEAMKQWRKADQKPASRSGASALLMKRK